MHLCRRKLVFSKSPSMFGTLKRSILSLNIDSNNGTEDVRDRKSESEQGYLEESAI
jgi:hypothetical protein